MSMISVRPCRSGNGRQVLRRTLMAVLPALGLSLTMIQASFADDHDWHGDRHDRHDDRGGGWHGDIRHFHDRDFDHWRTGRWYHGHHGGRQGWWWIVGPAWYAFSSPIYPYPDYSFDTDVSPDLSSGYWYWCAPLQAYYPYVQTCPVPWQQVIPAG